MPTEPGEDPLVERGKPLFRGRGADRQASRPPVANLSLARRERRALVRERERRIRDLGGLMLEMYRRDQFREDLIIEHCAQVMGIENRIQELEAILARGRPRRSLAFPRCACGAFVPSGARFCVSCGRPTELAATGELCARCLEPLTAGARFCPGCGAVVSELENSKKEQPIEHLSPEAGGERAARPEEGT